MPSREDSNTNRRRRRFVGFLLTVCFALICFGANASAEEKGEGLVVEVELARGQMVLHDGVILKIGSQTRLLGPNGETLTLSSFPISSRVGVGTAARSDGWVRWSGVSAGSEISARQVELVGQIIQ